MLCWNARSLNNKCDTTLFYLEDNKVDIAFITETWLSDKSSVTTGTIKSFGYDLIHGFRTDERGGGAAILFGLPLRLSPVDLKVKISTFDYVVGTLNVHCKVLLLCVYRTGPVISKFFEEFSSVLSAASLLCDVIVV